MLTRRCATTVTVLWFIMRSPMVLAVQQGVAPRPGEQVQVRILGSDDAIEQRCRGWIAALAQDTVILGHPRSCPRGRYTADIRVARGTHGSRLAHASVGFLVGALAGGVVARVTAGSPCRCPDGGYVIGIRPLFGTAAGALVGATLGAVMSSGPRWLQETTARPLRVTESDEYADMYAPVERVRGY